MTIHVVESPEDMVEFGRRLASALRAGDLVVLVGDLGAGKTTLTRGIGEGLGVRGAVTSPSYIIARVHPNNSHGPALVHVDAHRLERLEEVDDLDLDASLAESVTVVEWGEGMVDALSEDRLIIELSRADDSDDVRLARLRPVGARWEAVDLRAVFD